MDGVKAVTEPKISIIVPVYKVEPYLRKCLDSIVNQTYENLEIILVDDGSPDNCGAICDEYAARDERIRVIHKENGGVSSARNAGLDVAVGDWIGFVDADDQIEMDMFAALLKNAEAFHSDISICGFLSLTPGETGGTAFCCEKAAVLDSKEAIRLFLHNQSISFSCCDKLAKRSLWKQLRFSDVGIWEDFLAVCCLLEQSDAIACLPEVKYYYFTRPQSGLSVEDLRDRISSWEKIAGHYPAFASRWPQLAPLYAGRCVLMATGIWSSYCGAPRTVRREVCGKLQMISAFCQKHLRDAELFTEFGRAGKLVLKLTPHPVWWAFFIARRINWLYWVRHKRPL